MIKRILPIFISVFVISVNVLCAGASENILRGVSVNTVHGNSNVPYTIELISTMPSRMTKTIVSKNRIILNLHNISASTNLSTKFNGNKVIDNIMVEPCGQDKVNVMVQGDNIAYSNIEFKSPGGIEIAEDSLKSSVASLFGILSGNSLKDRGVQCGILAIFLTMFIGEILFVKSKYKEFQTEKQKMLENISSTKDFQDYLPAYGRAGVNKPYTTPTYGMNPVVNINTNITEPIKRLPIKTKEITTLNSLLYNKNREDKIIDRIVNNKPVFGKLSNIDFEESDAHHKPNAVTNPLSKSKLKANVKHLEAVTAKYKANTTIRDLNDIGNDLHARLNQIY